MVQQDPRRKAIDAQRAAYYEKLKLGEAKLAPTTISQSIIDKSKQPEGMRRAVQFAGSGGMVRPATEADDSNALRPTAASLPGMMSKGALVEGGVVQPKAQKTDTGDIDPPTELLPPWKDLDENAALIPRNYQDANALPWNDARALARLFRDGPVTNRADAMSVIDAEVERRKALIDPETGSLLNEPDPSPASDDQTGANAQS